MMKAKLLLSLILSLGFALPDLPAEERGERLDIGAEWSAASSNKPGRQPRLWVRNSRFPDGEGLLVAADGQLALRLTATGSEGDFHLYYREFLPCAKGDVFRGKAKVRGKGELFVQLYCYTSDGDSTGTLPHERRPIPVDSGEEFREVDFQIEIDDLRKGATEQVRFALVASAGSEVEVASVELLQER